jgi:hypothetical protein
MRGWDVRITKSIANPNIMANYVKTRLPYQVRANVTVVDNAFTFILSIDAAKGLAAIVDVKFRIDCDYIRTYEGWSHLNKQLTDTYNHFKNLV